jgi:ABC-type Na+ efflux pump permease subunit
VSQTALIFRKELLNFIRGDRSAFIVYLVLVAGWGALLAAVEEGGSAAAPLWIVFFALIVAVNFSSTVFVLERLSGSLEILLTCGISRGAILYGKMLFVAVMTAVIGAACLAFAICMRTLVAVPETGGAPEVPALASMPVWRTAVLYLSAAFLNAAGSAYFSVVLPNPRLLHFLNLFIAGFVMAVCTAAALVIPLPPGTAAAALMAAGVVFTVLARREFEGERVVKPVVL